MMKIASVFFYLYVFTVAIIQDHLHQVSLFFIQGNIPEKKRGLHDTSLMYKLLDPKHKFHIY